MYEKAYIIAVIIMSVVTFVMYAIDKRRAQHNRWRIPEVTLHLGELLGGWLGGYAGRMVLRHKSRKISFLLVSWVILALHAGLIVWWTRFR